MSDSDFSSSSSATMTSLGAQILYPLMVNGYLCNNAAEVQVARNGENPAALAGSGVAAAAGGITAPAAASTLTEHAVQAPSASSNSNSTSNQSTHSHGGTDLFA
ncbi:MAG: hypothetical protein RLZZ501_2220 [Pseudomonadota bacterium]